MIKMYCDRCGVEIPPSTTGGCRLRTGGKEVALQLCYSHQQELHELVADFCSENSPTQVKGPSLKEKVEV